ncbi:MAG: lipid biosynthesis B12-binding/radical SAM protein [Thermodesulfobacteriota bacterium]
MKVLLISANTFTHPYPVYPLGLDHVAGAVAEFHDVRIADLNPMGGNGAVEAVIHGFRPDIIGMAIRNVDTTDSTAPDGFVASYRDLIRRIRQAVSAPVVLGGAGFTIFPKEMMAMLDADYGVVGEGERFLTLLDALERGETAFGLPGIVTRESNAAEIPSVWKGRFGPRFQSESDRFGFYLQRGGMLNLQTKRGCRFRCIYCTYPRIEGRRFRFIPPDEVAQTARRLQEAGARYLFITDAVFNGDADHSLAVARAFRRIGLSVPWGGYFSPMRPPEGYYREMADAGMTHVEFGTESLCDAVLTAYRKQFRAADVRAAHRAARDAGLHIAHYFLLGGPGETPETLNQTLSIIDKLDRSVLFFFCGMRIYPHTELYDIAVKEGRISSDRNLLEPVYYRSSAIPPEEIVRTVREKAGGRPNWVIGSGGPRAAETIARMYQKGYVGPLWEYLIR